MNSKNAYWKAAKFAGIRGVIFGYAFPQFYLALYYGLRLVIQELLVPNKPSLGEFWFAFLNATEAGWLKGSVPAIVGAVLGGLFGLCDGLLLGILHKRFSLGISSKPHHLYLDIANGFLGLICSFILLYVLGSGAFINSIPTLPEISAELGIVWGNIVPAALVGLYAFVLALNILRVYDAADKREQVLAGPPKQFGTVAEDRNAIESYNRGLSYLQNRKIYHAISEFETYLRLAPNASDYAQVEEWLRELKAQ